VNGGDFSRTLASDVNRTVDARHITDLLASLDPNIATKLRLFCSASRTKTTNFSAE